MFPIVFYFVSPKYLPLLEKVLNETNQIRAGCQVGEDIYFKKYIKENITTFEQIDILFLDFTALADTDSEIMDAFESLRIIDYNIRFILFTPYKKEGDKFLKQCFYIGIYDIIITDEYLQMYEQITHCLTHGMRYKDALRFRDAVVEEEQIPQSMAIQKILVGITGAEHRMGCTHNSIVIANFLREQNQMVALLEMNQSNAFENACKAQKATFFEEGYFSLKGVDFYPKCGREQLTAISGKLYNFLLLDFGNYNEADKVTFNKCDVRLVFCGTKPWEINHLETIFKDQDEDVLKKYHFCFLGTTSQKLQKQILEHMNPLENIWFPEYTEDPFESSLFSEGNQIFENYLNPNTNINTKKTQKKKFQLWKHEKKS